MASEYGWTQDYILDHLTLEQVFEYMKCIRGNKDFTHYRNIEATTISNSFTKGFMKKRDYENYLKRLSKSFMKKAPIDTNKTLDQAKLKGVEIEEN